MIENFNNIITNEKEKELAEFVIKQIQKGTTIDSIDLFFCNKIFMDLGNSKAKLFFDGNLYNLDYVNLEEELNSLISRINKQFNKQNNVKFC